MANLGSYFNFFVLLMDHEEEETLSTPGVIEKYQTAAKVTNGNWAVIFRGSCKADQESLCWVKSYRSMRFRRYEHARRT